MSASESLSYGVLAGTAIYCVARTPWHHHPLDIVSYVAVGTTATFALLDINTSENELLQNLRRWAELWQTFFLFPCLVGNLWMRYGQELFIVYAHPAVMLVLSLLGSDVLDYNRDQVLTLGYSINEASCLYLSSIKHNMYGIAATVVYFCTELVVIFKQDISLPPVEAVNFGLCGVLLLFLLAYRETGLEGLL